MKDIYLLMTNGSYVKIRDDLITKEKLRECLFILIPIGNDLRVFTIIKPSNYLIFDNGRVIYEIGVLTDVYSESECFDYLDPIYANVNGISDLISLVNCIDRLDVVNMIVSDDLSYESFHYDLSYFGIDLKSSNDKKVYKKDLSQELLIPSSYDPNIFTDRFKDIYSGYTKTRIDNNRFIILSKDKRWRTANWISKSEATNSIIGVYTKKSNSIIFLTYQELKNVTKVSELGTHFVSFDISEDDYDNLNYDIKAGKYDRMEYYDSKVEYYFESYCLFDDVDESFEHLEVFSNLEFILNLTKITMDEIYGSSYPYIIEDGKLFQECVLSLFLTYRNGDKKEIVLNENSLLSLSDILSMF